MRLHRRRSVRLRAHDYRGGLHFVTVCTDGRQQLFGAVADGEMVLSPFGAIARDEWERTGDIRPAVVLDAFVVMPDPVHLLFGIVPDGETMHASDIGRTGVLRYAPTDERRRFESPPKRSERSSAGTKAP